MTNLIEEEKDNVVPFRLATGGDEGSTPWLETLELGTTFLVRFNTAGQHAWRLFEYHIVGRSEKATQLLDNLNSDGELMWVDPKLFSFHFTLHEVLGVHEPG